MQKSLVIILSALISLPAFSAGLGFNPFEKSSPTSATSAPKPNPSASKPVTAPAPKSAPAPTQPVKQNPPAPNNSASQNKG